MSTLYGREGGGEVVALFASILTPACLTPHRASPPLSASLRLAPLRPKKEDGNKEAHAAPVKRICCPLSSICHTERRPISTEGWTRRVHFVREGGGTLRVGRRDRGERSRGGRTESYTQVTPRPHGGARGNAGVLRTCHTDRSA